MRIGENSRVVSTAVAEKLKTINASLPPDVVIQPVLNRTELVNSTIKTVAKNLSEGAVLVSPYGTPMVAALIKTMEEDKIPGTSAGFGTAAAANGEKYPYMFPIAASYWSQTAAAVQFVKDKFDGDLKGKKIAYVFYDNPAGREGIPVMEALAKEEGYEFRTFAIPVPGIEAGPQVLDITRRFRADFVIAHVFGRAPAVLLKELKRIGYPMDQVIGLVWAVSEGDIAAALSEIQQDFESVSLGSYPYFNDDGTRGVNIVARSRDADALHDAEAALRRLVDTQGRSAS